MSDPGYGEQFRLFERKDDTPVSDPQSVEGGRALKFLDVSDTARSIFVHGFVNSPIGLQTNSYLLMNLLQMKELLTGNMVGHL